MAQNNKRRFEGEWVKLESLISKAKVKRCGSANYPVLSMTMHDGIVEQVNRFKKTIASKDTSSYKIVEPGQLVVGFPIDEGVIYVQGHDFVGIMSPAYNVWDIDRSKIHPAYLELALHSTRSMAYYADKMRGTTARRRSITDGNLLALEIPLPTLQAQNEIVSNLHQVNEIAAASKRRMEVLDDLVKSRFIEMFGDIETNSHGFDVKQLKNIAAGKLSYGSSQSSVAYDSDTRFLRITDIADDGSLNDKPVSPLECDDKYLLHDGDILFARSGATVGKTYRYKKSDGKAIYAGYLIRLVPNTELVHPDYIFWYTKSNYYESFVANAQHAVAQPNINAQEYGSLKILIPPLPLQQEFADFVTQVDKLRFDVQQQIEKLETLKQSLMQEYFE